MSDEGSLSCPQAGLKNISGALPPPHRHHPHLRQPDDPPWSGELKQREQASAGVQIRLPNDNPTHSHTHPDPPYSCLGAVLCAVGEAKLLLRSE